MLRMIRTVGEAIPRHLCLFVKLTSDFVITKRHPAAICGREAHRASRPKPGVDAMQITLAQGAVLWLPYVTGKRGYLVEQRVLRKVAHRPRSSCCCLICLSNPAEALRFASSAGSSSVANSDI